MSPLTDDQRKAATVVGIAYLFAMAASMFTEGYVRSTLISADAAATARNIAAHQSLFRASIGLELLTFVSDTTLIAALYVILSPISRPLALYATLLRMAGVAVGVMMAAHSFDVLRVLGTAPYLQAFDAGQLAALARLGVGSHTSSYNVVFVFLGAGSTVSAMLWMASGYVPRPLAMLGVFASVVLSVGTLAYLVVPELLRLMYPAYLVPMFFFEVGMGMWLLIKGLPPNRLSSR